MERPRYGGEDVETEFVENSGSYRKQSESQQNPEKIHFCPECGLKCTARDRFCQRCGYNFTKDYPEDFFDSGTGAGRAIRNFEEVDDGYDYDDDYDDGYDDDYDYDDEKYEAESKKGLILRIVLGVAGALLVIALIVGGFFFFTKSDKDSESEEKTTVEEQEEQETEEQETEKQEEADAESSKEKEEGDAEASKENEEAGAEAPPVEMTEKEEKTAEAAPKVDDQDVQVSFINDSKLIRRIRTNMTKIGKNDAYASASSVIPQDNVDNEPYQMLDDDINTNWQEGVDGPGIGQYAIFDLTSEVEVKAMTFKLGNWKDSNYYYNNYRPSKLQITVGKKSWVQDFPDEWNEFAVEFSSPIKTNRVQITIIEVYPTGQYQDTPITDVGIWY